MSAITITIDDRGKPVGLVDADKRGWRRFLKMVKEGEPGEIFTLEVWFPRDKHFHRMHLKMVRTLWDSQELFDDYDDFRKWSYIGIGHVTWVPGPDGQMVPIPKSIDYKSLDDEGIREIHTKSLAFFRSEYARKTLWPHLREEQTYDMVESLLGTV